MKPTTRSTKPKRAGIQGFTLAELLIAASIGLAILAAVASVFVLTARLVYKNQQINEAVTNSRLVQEHLNNQLSLAISQTTPVNIRPKFSGSSGTTPPRYSTISYRVPVGSFATVLGDTPSTSTTITINCPSDVTPMAGDYFLMDEPNLGSGILISSVQSSGNSAAVTLQQSLHAGSVGSDSTNNTNAISGKLVRIQRERMYQTVPPESVAGQTSTSPVTELRWFENTGNPSYLVISKNVDSTARYLFKQVPEDAGATIALESAISWQFSYINKITGTPVAGGHNSNFYQSNYVEGLTIPKSGDPLSTASILGGGGKYSTTTVGVTTIAVTTTQAKTTTKATTTLAKTTTTGATTTTGTTTTGKTTTVAKTSTVGKTTTVAKTTTKGTTTVAKTTTNGTTTVGKTTTVAKTTTKATTTVPKTTTNGTTTVAKTTTITTSILFDG